MNKRFFAEFIALLSLKINPDPYLSADPEIDILKRSDDEEGPNGDSGVRIKSIIVISGEMSKPNSIFDQNATVGSSKSSYSASRWWTQSRRYQTPKRAPSKSVKQGESGFVDLFRHFFWFYRK